MDGLMAKAVDMLDTSVRYKNCLESENILAIGDLLRFTESELLKVRNFGKTSLKEVKNKLAALGLSLVIAELFYKFHSFTLEAMAFLGTWYAVDRAINLVRRLLKF